MANDKREQMKRAIEQGLDHWHVMVGSGNLTNIGTVHDLKALVAAATAEGIPQADGWVAIETGLPTKSGEYHVTVEQANMLIVSSAIWGINGGTGEFCWVGEPSFRTIIAWTEKPAPYQRQPSEGDSNER